MDGPAQLPPKPDVALALLQSAMSVYVHLDPRGADVLVPAWFKKQPQLVLQVGMNMAVPIPDLDVGKTALSCTLSFNRRPEFCRIPWDAVYGLVGDDGRGMIWPESIPPEVASAKESRAKEGKPGRGHLRLAHSEPPPPVADADEVSSDGEAALDVAPPGVEVRASSPAPAEPRLSGNSNAAPRPRPTSVPPASQPPAADPRAGESDSPRQPPAAARGAEPTENERPSRAPSPAAAPSASSPPARPSKLPPYLRVVK